ncbi:MAG TPA: thioesterase family protein [Phenylobacterium sp.]|uniref:thioesterase family protein n=1 Tax=Phenylobacterium sp. TaxID=1871053 RepID=UPI002B4A5C82|nr:thioesterase family protein [Phenylobacterium sp.]HKR89487.1 thioesterase family protein [Phenylobacterium sp.]
MGEMVEVWRGGVATWECDSMGHLNVGFYMAKAMEALIGLAAELGMPHAFAPRAEATLIVREQHIRFLREAQVGARLHIDAGVLAMGEDDASVLLLMRHHDGEPAASFRMRVVHATAREGRAFPWPHWARARAAAITIEAPERAAPRSVSLDPVAVAASLPQALELGLQRIGFGGFRIGDCDAFGRMRTELVIARISDSVAHLMAGLLEDLAAGGRKLGAVALEYRLIYLDWPRAGDLYELRSGFLGAEPRLRRMVHWFLDPATGRPWASAEAVAAVFDVEARKTVALTETELAAWAAVITPGLTL